MRTFKEEEKMYNQLIDMSFNCKTSEDAKKLVAIFESNKWSDTNFRMLDWALRKNFENKFKNENTKTVKDHVVGQMPASLLNGRKVFIEQHMN